MVWLPSARLLVVKLAWPLAFRATLLANAVVPSLKVTVPAVTALPPLVTLAVKVTALFGSVVNDGFGVELTLVLVAASLVVVKLRHQPPAMLPPVPAEAESSTT